MLFFESQHWTKNPGSVIFLLFAFLLLLRSAFMFFQIYILQSPYFLSNSTFWVLLFLFFRVLCILHPDLCKSACLQLSTVWSASRRPRRRAPSLFRSKVPHMKHPSKNMLTSHLPVISEQLSETNTISQLVNKGLKRLLSYHIRVFEG